MSCRVVPPGAGLGGSSGRLRLEALDEVNLRGKPPPRLVGFGAFVLEHPARKLKISRVQLPVAALGVEPGDFAAGELPVKDEGARNAAVPQVREPFSHNLRRTRGFSCHRPSRCGTSRPATRFPVPKRYHREAGLD